MFPTTVRSLLARSAIYAKRTCRLPVRTIGVDAFNNAVVAQGRAFSVSSRIAFPVAVKKATSKSSKTKSKPSTKKKTTTARAKPSTKRTATKKAVPKKKKKVAAKKKPAKRRVKAKKPVIKKATPRTDPALRAPPRAVHAFSLYLQRNWASLQPKPKNGPEGLIQLRKMWTGLSDVEKQRYKDEALKITAERSKAYDEWRSKLSLGEVATINKYRKQHGHNKLGQSPVKSDKPLTTWMKFLQEVSTNGRIDKSKVPAGENVAMYCAKEAAKLWKRLSQAEKDAYKS
ncbi:hypothetical protein FRB91_010725 [Serendipita sp. 411]|nr:hypothetical protein FRC15_001837 [Serendipita sp. 397]KAG8800789.1 hypothetical protein FRC16_002069 [Serendipita sp. 398]KAG8835635.1 hypothetical protein FRC18_000184 [Serendipita sp. 400]KAG8857883.1 hypothetical protein FRB91_010725 [Serendipita sp. 411]KAG8869534.1 hypothetical protein FRC20_001282 [Serendipita sp. 405]KAG9055301.1 hypothetical protein FS842_002554 [Serendipita sp. 407]